MKLETEIAVLGAGFAGSLCALLLERIGRRVVLIDRGRHPRFAIGESTTPSANLVLRDLARQYDLPRLAPLAKYGRWKSTYPDIVCGPKRGFSYFQQRPGERFQSGEQHARELLVAASSTLPTADTHWLRSDVDRFLVGEVESAGIPYLDRCVVMIDEQPHGFRLSGERAGLPVQVDAKFLIDATGEAGVVLRKLGIAPVCREMLTNSRGLFGHFTGLNPWRGHLEDVDDHPFDCDQSALHQVLAEGWMWQLRFDNGITSAGFALDGNRCPLDHRLSPQEEWQQLMSRYPSLAEQFSAAELVAPAGGLVRTTRLQRRAAMAAGENWAALPNTAGFIDPLHSTGIAHSLCGIERLIDLIRRHWGTPALTAALKAYEQNILTEVDFVDEIVGSCYASLHSFDVYGAICMLYFAAATTWERRRLAGERQDAGTFLCANDPELRALVTRNRLRVNEVLADPQPDVVARFRAQLADELQPYNHVGLFAPEIPNLYRHTAVPETGDDH